MKSLKPFYTTTNLFYDIWDRVKNDLPEGLSIDYALPENDKNTVSIKETEFCPVFLVNPNCCEGIYIDLSIHGVIDETETHQKISIGTVKTLQEGKTAISLMSQLCGDLLNAYFDVMEDKKDEMCRCGFSLRFVKSNGSVCGFGYVGKNKNSLLNRFESVMKSSDAPYDHGVLTDLLTQETQELRL